jgi:CRP/FNR family transcriptional regulator
MTVAPELALWLGKTLMFQNIDSHHLEMIAAIAQVKSYGKGDLVFKEGDKPKGFFIVRSGRVKIYKIAPGGKEQILRIFHRGEHFAEIAVFDNLPFPASAATLEQAEMIFFPRSPFLEMLVQHPALALNMLSSLSRHLRHLTAVIEELSFKDVPQRLASYLLRLGGVDGGTVEVLSPWVTLDLPKSQLAAQLGTIPATLSRAFYQLKNEDLIAVKGAEIQLLDCDRLRALAKQGDGIKN